MLKPGYKQTDLGVLPEEWEVAEIEQVADVKGGKRLPLGKSLTNEVTPHPYIRIVDVYQGGVSLQDIKYVPVDAFPPIKNYRIYKDDLFITVAGTLGLVGKVPKELDGANLTENADRLTNLKCNQDYLLWVMLSPFVQAAIEEEKTTGAQPKLALTRIKKFQFPLPPPTEQQAIAEALGAIDTLLTSQQELLAKKRALKLATQQALLSGERRLPGFAGGWGEKTLGELSQIKTGKKNNEDKSERGKYPFFVRSQEVERINSYSFDGEAILLPGEGNIGSIFHYINGKFDYHQRVYKVSNFLPNVSGRFVYHYMKEYFGEHAMLNTVKAAVDSLRLPTFQEFFIKLPSLDEQRAIAAILSDMDAELEALAAQLAKTQALKQGMMQDLLTGAIRLTAGAAPTSTHPIQ